MISLALNMNGLWLLTRLTGFKSTAGEVSCDLAWLRNTTYYFILMLKQGPLPHLIRFKLHI